MNTKPGDKTVRFEMRITEEQARRIAELAARASPTSPAGRKRSGGCSTAHSMPPRWNWMKTHERLLRHHQDHRAERQGGRFGDNSAAPTVDDRLVKLAEDINRWSVAAEDSIGRAVTHAMDCGEALLEAKALVPPGQWHKWLNANTRVSLRTAQRWIQLVNDRNETADVLEEATDDEPAILGLGDDEVDLSDALIKMKAYAVASGAISILSVAG